MRILIVSNSSWDDSNSFGSSYTNIFGGNGNYEIANIYCESTLPRTRVPKRFFQITEKTILASLKNRNEQSGKEISIDNNDLPLGVTTFSVKEKYRVSWLKKKRWQIFFWVRDLVWSCNNWKSKNLDEFIDSFNPDLIFQPIYYSSYINEIALYAKKRCNVPMVGYISDDCYTLKQYSLSPFYWIDRLIKRKYVKRAIDACQILYTITATQQKEYNRIFGNKCKVLCKGGNFDKENFEPKQLNKPLRFLYTGNIGDGRWKTLGAIAQGLKKANKESIKAQMSVYSQTVMTEAMSAVLNIEGTSAYEGCVAPDVVRQLQRNADVLIHVESFSLKEKYKARLSFSTKIVDYLESGHCVLAAGWNKTGGIETLIDNDGAYVIDEESKIADMVNELVMNPEKITEYAKKGYECGKKLFKIDEIRANLYKDLKTIVKK